MSEERPKGEKFLKKAEREACWKAKDKYWSCLQASNENEAECINPRKVFTDLCPPTWVTHFDRKFQYEKFKANLAKAGYEEVDQKYSGGKKQE